MKTVDGPVEGVVVTPRRKFTDSRGWLMETFRCDEIGSELTPAMGYTSVTLPGVVRGPHEHADQTDFFVFLGPGNFKIWLWDNREGSPTYGNRQVLLAGEENPRQVIVPPGVVHAYRCLGPGPGFSQNFPNRLYAGEGRRHPVDEIRHENDPNTPFKID